MDDGTHVQHLGRAAALARMADAFVHALGGTAAILRFPGAVPSDETNRELGIEAPEVDEVVVAPVVVHRLSTTSGMPGRTEIIVAARTLEPIVEARRASDGRDLLGQAVGVVYAGTAAKLGRVYEETFGGTAYLYRIEVVDPNEPALKS